MAANPVEFRLAIDLNYGRDHRTEIGFELNGHNNEQSTSVACGSYSVRWGSDWNLS
jgi:hypothetical protein